MRIARGKVCFEIGPPWYQRDSAEHLFPSPSFRANWSYVDLICAEFVTSGTCYPASGVDPIDEAWATVEAAWGDQEAHRRFMGICMALGHLPEAGRRYREVREGDPARAEAAAKHIDTLLVLATQQLQDTRVAPPTSEHKRTLTWAAFFIMLVLMGAGTWLLMRG